MHAFPWEPENVKSVNLNRLTGMPSTRFIKYFFPHLVFGHKKVYVEEIKKVSLERLARLIKVCGFLLQTKVYLFWKNLNV